MKILFIAAAAALSCAALAPAAYAQSESLSQSPGLSQIRESDWHAFSRSATTIYLADAGMLGVTGGVTTIDVAKVPRTAPGADQPAYRVERYQYRCGEGQFRSISTSEHDAAGQEIDRFDEGDAAWEGVPRDGFLRFLASIACDGHRSTARTWGSIPEFIAAGKPE